MKPEVGYPLPKTRFEWAARGQWISQVIETLAETLSSPPATGGGAAAAVIAIRYIGCGGA